MLLRLSTLFWYPYGMTPEIKIIHQDQWLIAVEKPSGLLVHRSDEANDKIFLLQLLRNQIGQHVFPVHRLDRAVSGIVVFALNSEGAKLLQESLNQEATLKEYLALVRGRALSSETISLPLSNDRGIKQSALTSYEMIKVFDDYSFIKVQIKTGRRHQIRRHLEHIKHHVIGDTKYGKGRINAHFREQHNLKRIFLHASKLKFFHKEADKEYLFESPLPEDLQRVMNRLDVNSSII